MKVQRNYKDTVFRMIFNGKKELLSLYNAVNGTDYTDEEGLEINTLENAVYMNVKNDISFVFDFYLNLYEHQASINPNMPLRDLLYVSDLLHNLVKDKDLYGSGLVKIPTPRFIVFYNGQAKQPERQIYRLSDAFTKYMEEPELELAVTVININLSCNQELMESCKLLKEYMEYVETVRSYSLTMPIEQAVEKAVDECIQREILAGFLSKNRAEAIAMSIYEYNEEAHLENVRREGYEEGREEAQIRLQNLIRAMTEGGEGDRLSELADADFLKKMVQKYHL